MIFSLICLLLAVIAVIVFGVVTLRCRSSLWATVCEGVGHGIGALAIAFCLGMQAPYIQEVFLNMGVEFPASTQATLMLSRLFQRAPLLLFVMLLLFVAGDTVMFWQLNKQESTRRSAKFVSASLTGFLAAFLFLFWIGLLSPLTKISDGLS